MYAASRRALLPSLDHNKVSSKTFDPSGIVCSQPPANSSPACGRSTGAPSEAPSSRSSSTHSREGSSIGSWIKRPSGASSSNATRRCDTPPDGNSSSKTTPARRLDTPPDGNSPSRPSGEAPVRRARTLSDPCGAATRGCSRDPVGISSSSRAPSGSRPHTPTGQLRTPAGLEVVAPLSPAQLESASDKLKVIEATQASQKDAPRPSSRSGWETEQAEQGGSGMESSIMPTVPGGSRDSPGKRPGRQWFGLPFGQPQKDNRQSTTQDKPSSSSAGTGASTDSVASSSMTPSVKDSRHLSDPRHSLNKGSRDDSFLSTISESTTSDETCDSKRVFGPPLIDVYSDGSTRDKPSDVLQDFRQLFAVTHQESAEQMQQLLRCESFDKPLPMQRNVVPVIKSAFQDESKSFITIQGSPHAGKTSALALGILGAVGSDMTGIRAIALSTGDVREFKKCFDIVGDAHPIRLCCFESSKRRVSFAGLDADPVAGVSLHEDMERLCSDLGSGAPGMIYGHPSRVLPLLREAPAWGIDLSNVQVLALDDAEDAIRQGLMDEVCEVCTILRHFSKQRLRHIMLSHFLSNESKSLLRCLRTSLVKQSNLFGIQAHRTQARAKAVNHYFAVAPRARWPAMLAVLHHALSLPSGIIFDDESVDARTRTRVSLRSLGVTASVWNALAEQKSGARAAARDGQAGSPKGPAFHLMPSDLAVLKVDLPMVRCILHFDVPKKELSVYGLRLMCLEQQEQKKGSRKNGMSSKSLSVLFVEEADIVRELEKTYHIRMQEVPLDMLPS